jgi:hypothetical protein
MNIAVCILFLMNTAIVLQHRSRPNEFFDIQDVRYWNYGAWEFLEGRTQSNVDMRQRFVRVLIILFLVPARPS